MTDVAFPKDAVWIGSDHPFDLHEAYLCFRRVFTLATLPQHAELWITADSRYKLWINGQFVARGPARSWPHVQCVDRLDLAPYLQAGNNVLAAQVYQPGYSHFAYVHRGAAGLLAWLVGDGETMLMTGRDWRTRRDPSFAAVVPQISIYSSGMEERDLSLDDNWQGPNYDDSRWANARVVAPLGGYPWTGLQLRPLPLLVEREIPMTLIETRRGPALPALDAHLNLRQSWAAASLQVDSEGGSDRLRVSRLGKRATEVATTSRADADGWFRVTLTKDGASFWLFDLGRDFIGQGWIEIESARGEERVSVSYAEKIRDGQLILSDPGTYCRVRMTDRFRLRTGNQVAETFALRGGRYLLFQLSGPTGPDLRLQFRARVAEYPLEISRPLETPDPVLARIVRLCENTFRACLLDGFIDSTWRESSQWTGDALPQALIMASMSDDTRPLRRVIEMAAQGAYPDGVLPSVLPGEVHAYTVVDYNFIWVELLSLYRKLSGDEEFVAAMWPTLVKMLDRFHQDINPDGLIISQPGRRLFLDWAPLSRNEPNAVYNLHYLLALRAAASLATARRAADEADRWNARASALRDAVRSAFWRDGVWYDDAERTTFSQLAAALALLAGAAEPGSSREQSGLLDAIAARSFDPDDEPPSTALRAGTPGKMVLASPFMHHYIFEALRQGGRSDEVVEIIRRRWGRWAEAGYPTTWENWNVDFPDGSQCHAFSAHPRYHLAEIARERGGL